MDINKFVNLNLPVMNTGNKLLNFINYRELLKQSEKCGKYDTWVILGCGPSLSLFRDNYEFREMLEKYPVISLKQAGKEYPDVTNFQIFNEVRYEQEFANIGNYRLSVSEFQKGSNSNIHFPIKSYKLKNALFRTNNYENFELSTSFSRPWGVGVLFELAIFLPVLFGCKNIVLCGVDMNYSGNYHFYDGKAEEDSKSYKVDEFEFYYTKGTAYYLEYWLKKKGISILNLSPLSELPLPKFKTVNEVLESLK